MNMEADDRTASGKAWMMKHGDCHEVMATMPEASVHLTVTSIPFASLFTYSASERDAGNCSSHDQFFEQFAFWTRQLLRVTKPGRIAAIHCMNLPTSKTRDGVIGLSDFRGRVIAAMQDAGWIYHAETTIWKDPVTAMQRTKALGLLWKQIKKDSTMSRMGLPDYLVMFRKPGANEEPVAHTPTEFPVDQWQQWASPVWMDIDQSDTLNFRVAREEEDERHLCALQLEVIRRAMVLYSNPGEVLFDPFGGIGSTGYVALRNGRKFAGVELKRSYFEQAVKNLRDAETRSNSQGDLFASAGAQS
jgi:DNA modification methylase